MTKPEYRVEWDETGGYDCMTGCFSIKRENGDIAAELDLRYYRGDAGAWPDPALYVVGGSMNAAFVRTDYGIPGAGKYPAETAEIRVAPDTMNQPPQARQ